MNRLTFFACLIFLSISRPVFAQNDVSENKPQNNASEKNNTRKNADPEFSRKAYIGFSMGINNPAGIIGFDLDIPIVKYVSIGAGFGPSTWGNKIYIGSRYYLKPSHRGLALGAGITHNSGSADFTSDLETIYGKENVTLKLHAQTNSFIGVYYFRTLGKRYNRLCLQAGYSVPFRAYRYSERHGDPLSTNGEKVVKTLSPGGIVLGIGFSFGVH